METSPTLAALRQRFGERIGALCIGPAGEMRLTAAAVATTDESGVQLRVAGRGGLGAVMGAKGIKAIVFDAGDARRAEPVDPKALAAAARELARILRDDPKTDNRHNFGTPAVLALCDTLGILPTRNFREGRFEQAEAISGEMIAELIDRRGGEGRRGLPCVQGCIIACSNVFADPSGKTTVASLHPEVKQIKGRVFEVPMSGGFLLTEYCEGLEDYFKIGEEIDCFNSKEEALEKINYYLRADDKREKIAAAGCKAAHMKHTWERRFSDIFRTIEREFKDE